MAVHCSNCGEELMGAVNRCWKCGQAVLSHAGPAELPPVRVPLQDIGSVEPGKIESDQTNFCPVEAEEPDTTLLDPATADANGDHAPTEVPMDAVLVDDTPSADLMPMPAPSGTVAPTSDATTVAAAHSPLVAPPAYYPRHTAAAGGALGAVVLGLLSFVGIFFAPLGAMITAVLGVAMGIWGIYSRYRPVAIFGLSLCCVALIVASCFWAAELYEQKYGHSIWQQPEEI